MGGGRLSADAPRMTHKMGWLTLVKGLIGAGLLGLPKAFGSVGLALAVPGIFILAVINAIGASRLIEAKVELQNQRKNRGIIEDSETDSESEIEDEIEEPVAENDYGLGPVGVLGVHYFGAFGLFAAILSVMETQLGIGLAYVVYIGVTLDSMEIFADTPRLAIRIGCCVVYCILCQIRRLESLAVLSLLALITYAVVVLDLVYRGWEHIVAGTNIAFQDAWVPIKWSNTQSWFGTTIFSFEGIVLAQYVFDSMKLPSMRAYRGVLFGSYASSCVLFCFVGAYGYLAYGDSVMTPIYLNFPTSEPDAIVDKVILVFVLMLSFALQMFPVFSFADSILIGQKAPGASIASDSSSDDEDPASVHLPRHTRGKQLLDILVRSAIVIFLCVLGELLPAASCVTDLVGGVFMSLMAFALPGALHMAAFKGHLSVGTLMSNILLLLVGLVSTVISLVGAPACFAKA